MIREDQKFYFVGGRDASSLEELADVLDKIDDAEFVFHVNEGKNDFANWTEGVFSEKELASEMRTILEKKRFIELLDNFLAERRSGSSESASQANEDFEVKEAKSWDDVDTDAKEDDSLPSFESDNDSPPISYDRPKLKMPPLHVDEEKSFFQVFQLY